MGFFAKLKELFNKNIECDADMKSHIVFFLKKKKYLYLNKNIVVRDNQHCVVVYKSKVTDVILPGKHKIDENSIPDTYKKARVEKLNKKGHKVKKIRVGLYFVSKEDFANFQFDSDEPFLIKSKDLGRIKGYMKGICNVKVLDAGLLVKSLINETGYEKNDEVNKDIGLWIGNKVNRQIEKDKMTIDVIINKRELISSILSSDLEDAFDNIGVFVNNIKLKAIDFPKKYQKKLNKRNVIQKTTLKTDLKINDLNTISSQGVLIAKSQKSVANGTMQTNNNYSNKAVFKVCNKCGFKNHISNTICKNCNNKLD